MKLLAFILDLLYFIIRILNFHAENCRYLNLSMESLVRNNAKY